MWIHDRTNAMKIGKRDVKEYATKSISGKYNTKILEFVKSFTQHFNSKTTNSQEALTIKEIDFQFAIDKNEILWLLDTQHIRLKIENRSAPMYIGSKKQAVDDEGPARRRGYDQPLKNINQLESHQLAVRNKTDNKQLL